MTQEIRLFYLGFGDGFMKRRDFLGSSLSALGGLVLLNSCQHSQTLISPLSSVKSRGKVFVGMIGNSNSSILRVLDLDTEAHFDIELPIRSAHSVIRNKKDPDEYFVFESFGSAVKVNTRTKKIIKIKNYIINPNPAKIIFLLLLKKDFIYNIKCRLWK